VRPAHTYDDANPPLPGGWTVDIYTWDQIYTIVADALGVDAKLVHVASKMFPVVAPDWFWSDLLVGDLAHSAVFDNAKIHRFVPSFAPKLTFHRAAARIMDWRRSHPDQTRGTRQPTPCCREW
jgi:nucleoside-diphosphate-sugar epimerase